MNRSKTVSVFLLLILVVGSLPLPPAEGAAYTWDYVYSIEHDDADAFSDTKYGIGDLIPGTFLAKNTNQLKYTNNSDSVTVGLIFENIQVEQGAEITSAQLLVDIRNWDQRWVYQLGRWGVNPTSLFVWCANLSDTPATFSTLANFETRMAEQMAMFASRHLWAHDGWTAPNWLEFQVRRGIQVVIDREDWVPGNNIVFFISVRGRSTKWPWFLPLNDRYYEIWGLSHDFSPEYSPKLFISTSGPLTISDFSSDPMEEGFNLEGMTSYRGQPSNTFFSNYTESFWSFAGIGGKKYISESIRENNWNNWTKVMETNPSGWKFDVWLEPNGKDFWMEWDNGVGLHMRKGYLMLGGESEVGWYADEQLIEPYNQGGRQRIHHSGSIITSKSGNPFIFWTRYDTDYKTSGGYVSWTDTTDGTWNNTYTRYLEQPSEGAYYFLTGKLLPDYTRDYGVYLIFSDITPIPQKEKLVWYLNTATSISTTDDFDYRGSLVNDGYTYNNIRGFYKWDASANFDGFAAFVFTEDDNCPPTRLLFRYRNSSDLGDSWSTNEYVTEAQGTGIIDDWILPQVVVDEHNNSIVFWVTRPINVRSNETVGNTTMYYKIRYGNGTWGDVVVWQNLTYPTYGYWANVNDVDFNVDINYNAKDMREYELTSYGAILDTYQPSYISDTFIDTGINQWDEKLWLADNWTDVGGFNNMSFRFVHSTTSMDRINSGSDQWVYSPFMASTRFENFTTDSGDDLSRVAGLFSYHNSGNEGPTTWRWGLYARNGSTIVTDLQASWGSYKQTHYIDVRFDSNYSTIIAEFYDDLTFTNLLETLTITDPDVIYGVYNYSWGLHMRYVANQNYGIDVSMIASVSESNEFASIGTSDVARSPISVLWSTQGNYWNYHDYLFINSSEQRFFGAPF